MSGNGQQARVVATVEIALLEDGQVACKVQGVNRFTFLAMLESAKADVLALMAAQAKQKVQALPAGMDPHDLLRGP